MDNSRTISEGRPFRQDVGLFGMIGFFLVSPIERAMVYRDRNEDEGTLSEINMQEALVNIKRQQIEVFRFLFSPGRLARIWKRLFTKADSMKIIPEMLTDFNSQIRMAEESKENFSSLLGHITLLIDAYSIFSTLSMMAVKLDDDSWNVLSIAFQEIISTEISRPCGSTPAHEIWDLVTHLKFELFQSLSKEELVFNVKLFNLLRVLRRGLDDIVGDYDENMSNHNKTTGKPLVMQVKIEHSRFQIFGQAAWDTCSYRQECQYKTIANVTSRIRFVKDDDKVVAVMCEPHKVESGEKTACGVPIPRYALIELEYAKFNMLGKFTVRSGDIGDDGKRVGPSKSGPDYEYIIDMEKYAREESTELPERQVLVAGPQVPQGLLEHHIANEILPNPQYENEAWEATRTILEYEFSADAVRAARRYQEVLRSAVPSPAYNRPFIQNDEYQETKRHADMDDSVRKLRAPKRFEWGAILEQPRGTEWRERVPYSWSGDVHGDFLRVEMNRSTGIIKKLTRRRFIPIKSSSIDVDASFTLGPFSLGLTANDVKARQARQNNIEPTELLRSTSPALLVRMALASVELQNLRFGKNSACYLPVSRNGQGIRHIASIPSNAIDGNDVYYRKRDDAIFLLTGRRSFRIMPGKGSCKYHVSEQDFEKEECVLAFLKLEDGTVGH